MHKEIKGTGVALITPFKKDFTVDTTALTRLVEDVTKGGVDFLVALGTTSEAPTLSAEERKLVVQTILHANAGKLPVVLGIGGNNTAAVLQQINQQDFNGIDAILSVVPYYNKPSQAGMMAHFEAIANASPVPVVLYNVPGRTGANLKAAACLHLAKHQNIIAVKEASGDLQQIMEILRDKPDHFCVLSGDDALTMPLIALGAEGVISVAANAWPRDFSQMVRWQMAGKTAEARKLHYQMLALTGLLFADGNPGGVKALMAYRGLCDEVVRLPLVPVQNPVREQLIQEWKQNKIV